MVLGQPGKGVEQEEQVSTPGKRQDSMDRHKRREQQQQVSRQREQGDRSEQDRKDRHKREQQQQVSRQREQGDKSEQMQILAKDSTKTDRTSGPGSGGTQT